MFDMLNLAINTMRRRLIDEERIYFYETDDGKYEVRDIRVVLGEVLSEPSLVNRYMRFTVDGGLVFKYHHNVKKSNNLPTQMTAQEARKVIVMYALAEVEYIEETNNITSHLVRTRPRI
ncbi:hypothetical protein [Domibacillus aminovorans]|uniref:Uncharacterized protein n=1 Tax=Domibacillus aminovorans TaxID=29332 RepID=A0A177L8G7_9BACI|nr:hypothetical protein [Domibacillus aminovorans]OAH61592.1 hypothetical protein AWH49_11615 [Domibacillus aminovorans]